MKKCYLCGSNDFIIKNKSTRDRKKLRVLHCSDCSLTFLESFKHLDDFSYKNSENNYEKKIINQRDYIKLLTQLKIDDQRRFNQWQNLIKNKSVLDFGSGAGGFLKYAKKIAAEVCGVEIDSITRFYNSGIEIKKDIKEFSRQFDVITCFHVVEHIPDPVTLLRQLKEYLKPNGVIIIEVPNDNDALINYYNCQPFKDFTYWSLHLYSYNKKTLKKLCAKAGYKKIQVGFFQRYPLANHIGWLKDGRPGGHNIYKALNNDQLNEVYKKQLAKIDACDTLVAVIKKD